MTGEPCSEAQLKRVCRAAIQTGATVLTTHAMERMEQEGLIMNDVLNTLRGGRLLHFDLGGSGAYKYRLTTGRIDVVVVVTGPTSIVIVTAFRSAR